MLSLIITNRREMTKFFKKIDEDDQSLLSSVDIQEYWVT